MLFFRQFLLGIVIITVGIVGIVAGFFLETLPVLGVISYIIGLIAFCIGIYYFATEYSETKHQTRRSPIILGGFVIGLTIALIFVLLLPEQDPMLLDFLFVGVIISGLLYFLMSAAITLFHGTKDKLTALNAIGFVILAGFPIIFASWVAYQITFVPDPKIYYGVLEFYSVVLGMVLIFSPHGIPNNIINSAPASPTKELAKTPDLTHSLRAAKS